MRTPRPPSRLLAAVASVLAACGGEAPTSATPDAPATDAESCSGRGLACPCPGGAGVYVCEGGAARCSCPAVDAAALDVAGPDVASSDVVTDAASDAGPDGLVDVVVDAPTDAADVQSVEAGADVQSVEAGADAPPAEGGAPSDAGVPCGATTCAPRPGAVAVCTAGECVYACRLGFADCNAREADGCEVDLRSDAMNCGRCERACRPANGAGACVDSACALAACSDGFADCDGALANGCEVDLRTAVAHCGACGRACAGSGRSQTRPLCEAGSCVTRCVPFWGDCDGSEANGCEVYLCQDPMNCGRCGRACTPLPHVVGGSVCGGCEGPATCSVTTPVTCETGWGTCRGTESWCGTDLMNDPNNCGTCERRCVAPMRCVRGACQS